MNDDLIYVNPMIFLHVSKCPFIQTERQLPLEMPYTEHILQATMLTIPEGYAVEELPKPLNLKRKTDKTSSGTTSASRGTQST